MRSKRRFAPAALAATLTVLVVAPVLAEWTPPPPLLDEAELQELASDRTWRGEGPLARWVIWSSPDGGRRMSMQPGRGGAFDDVGRWWIEDGQICTRWQRHVEGLPICLTVAPTRSGDAYEAYYPDGRLHARFTVERGNPDRL